MKVSVCQMCIDTCRSIIACKSTFVSARVFLHACCSVYVSVRALVGAIRNAAFQVYCSKATHWDRHYLERRSTSNVVHTLFGYMVL